MPTREERLAALERDMAELKQSRLNQDTLHGALLARIDSFIGDLHRIERDQKSGFREVKAEIREVKGDLSDLSSQVNSLEQGFNKLLEVQGGYKTAIEQNTAEIAELKTGQLVLQESVDQILAILTGKAKTHD